MLLLITCVMGCAWGFSENEPTARAALIPAAFVGEVESAPQQLSTLAGREVYLKVIKSKRAMYVLAGDSILRTYTIVLGENPVGDKQFQGDKKTPEGTFTFRDKYPHANWHKFVWIDYPNAESWTRFNERKKAGTIPESAKIGGEIGIHGVPDGMDEWIENGQDWTFGCIGMKNADIDEIYPHIIPNKTMLTITP